MKRVKAPAPSAAAKTPRGPSKAPSAGRTRRRRPAFAGLAALCLLPHVRSAEGKFWDVPALQRPPVVEWGKRDGLVQEIYYTGEPLAGKPTRVFAYLGRPPELAASGAAAVRFPAVVLVHGGGGQAFRVWAERWAQRGYVALTMDLSGNGPGKVKLPDGGPPLTQSKIFLAADDDDAFREGWTYHAAAAVMRARSIIAALSEVDPDRIGITGISWGGYLTSLVAGLDRRYQVVVPVYGAGFLHESSHWKKDFTDPMTPEQRARWVRLYEPSSYLAAVAAPTLFVNGPNDPRFFLDGHRRSTELVRPELRHLAIVPGLKHGHLFAIPEVDRFVDAALKGRDLPPQFTPPTVAIGVARSTVAGPAAIGPVARAELHHAVGSGPWAERKWLTIPATLEGNSLSATIPAARPLLVYFSVLDARGVRATSAYLEIAP